MPPKLGGYRGLNYRIFICYYSIDILSNSLYDSLHIAFYVIISKS